MESIGRTRSDDRHRRALDRVAGRASNRVVPRIRRAGIAAALAAAPFALAYRFALIYRTRAGFPTPRPPQRTPADLGLAFEDVAVPHRATG